MIPPSSPTSPPHQQQDDNSQGDSDEDFDVQLDIASNVDGQSEIGRGSDAGGGGIGKKKKKKGMFGGLKVPKALRTKKKHGKTEVQMMHSQASMLASEVSGDVPSLAVSSFGLPPTVDTSAHTYAAAPSGLPTADSMTHVDAASPGERAEVETLRQKLEEAEQTRLNLETESESLQLILKQKDTSIAQLKNEVDTLERKILDLNPEATSPKGTGRLDELAVKIQTLYRELEVEKEQKDKLQSEHDALGKELIAVKEEAASLRQALDKAENLIDQRDRQLEDAEVQLKVANERLRELAENSGATGSQVMQLTDELDSIQKKLKETESAKSAAEAQVKNLQFEAENFRQTLSAATGTAQQASGWKAELESLRVAHMTEKTELQRQLMQAEGERSAMQQELAARSERIAELSRDLRFVTEDMAAQQIEKTQASEQIIELQAANSKLQSQLRNQEELHDDTVRDLSMKNQQIEDFKKTIDRLTTSEDTGRQQLVQELQEAQNTRAALSLQVDKLQATVADNEKTIAVLKTNNETLKAQVDETNSSLKAAREETKEFRRLHENSNSRQSFEKEAADRDKQAAMQQLERLRDRIAVLENNLATVTQSKTTAMEEASNAQAEVERLKRSLENSSRSLADRRTADEMRTRDLEKDLSQLRADKRQLTTELNEKTVEIARTTNQLSVIQMKLDVAETTNEELKGQLKKLTENRSEITSALGAREVELQRQLMENSNQRDLLQLQLTDTQRREADARRELGEHKSQIEQLNEKLSAARKELSGLQVETSIVDRRLQDVKQENEQLKALNDELKRTSASVLQDTLKNSQQTNFEVSNLKLKLQQMERDYGDAQRDAETLQKQLDDSVHAKTQLKQQLESARGHLRESEDLARQLESKAVESDLQVSSLKLTIQEAYKREAQLVEEAQNYRNRLKNQKASARQAGTSSVDSIQETPKGTSPLDISAVLVERPAGLSSLAPGGPPPATIFSGVVASLGGPSALRQVRSDEGMQEVIVVLKQRLLDALFELGSQRQPKTTVIGGVFGEALDAQRHPFVTAADGKPEVLRVLQRVKSLWKLGEDLRLALVQSDAALADLYQNTKTTHADWESTLQSLRGSAEIIEDRNRELERLAGGYSMALDETRTMAKLDREKAKSIISTLKRRLEVAETRRQNAESERQWILTDNANLQASLRSTLEDNSRLRGRTIVGPFPSQPLIPFPTQAPHVHSTAVPAVISQPAFHMTGAARHEHQHPPRLPATSSPLAALSAAQNIQPIVRTSATVTPQTAPINQYSNGGVPHPLPSISTTTRILRGGSQAPPGTGVAISRTQPIPVQAPKSRSTSATVSPPRTVAAR